MAIRKSVDQTIGEAIGEAIRDNGQTQVEFGQATGYSNRTISAAKTGAQRVTLEMLQISLRQLDHPRLYLKAVHGLTGGVFSSPVLDGEAIDLHRTSVWRKTIEELHEALAVMEAVESLIINSPMYIGPEQRQLIREAMIQLIDARVGSDNCLAVMCQEYAIRPRELFAEHARKLQSKEYIKKDRYESGADEMV